MHGQGGAWSLVCGLWAPGDPQFERSLPVACGALSRATVELPSYSWEQNMESESKIEVKEEPDNLKVTTDTKKEENCDQSMVGIETRTMESVETLIFDQHTKPEPVCVTSFHSEAAPDWNVEPDELVIESGLSKDSGVVKVGETNPADTKGEMHVLPAANESSSVEPVVDNMSYNHSTSGSHRNSRAHCEESVSGIITTVGNITVEPTIKSEESDLSPTIKEEAECDESHSGSSGNLPNIEWDPQNFMSELNSKLSIWKKVIIGCPAKMREKAFGVKVEADTMDLNGDSFSKDSTSVPAENSVLPPASAVAETSTSSKDLAAPLKKFRKKEKGQEPGEKWWQSMNHTEQMQFKSFRKEGISRHKAIARLNAIRQESGKRKLIEKKPPLRKQIKKIKRKNETVSPRNDLSLIAEDPILMQDMNYSEKLQFIDFRQDGIPPGEAVAKISEMRRERGTQNLIMNKIENEPSTSTEGNRMSIGEPLKQKLKIFLKGDECVAFQKLRESGMSRVDAWARIQELRVHSHGSGSAENLDHPDADSKCADSTSESARNQVKRKVNRKTLKVLRELKKEKKEVHEKFSKFDQNQKGLYAKLQREGVSHPDAVNKVQKVTKKLGNKNIKYEIFETLFSSGGPEKSISASIERFLRRGTTPGPSQVQVSSATDVLSSSTSGASNPSMGHSRNIGVTATIPNVLENASEQYPDYGDFLLGLTRHSKCEHSLDELVQMAQQISEDHGMYGKKLFILRCFQFGVDPGSWNWGLYSAVPSAPKTFPHLLMPRKTMPQKTPPGSCHRPSCTHSSCKYFASPVAALGRSSMEQQYPDHRTAHQSDNLDPVGVQWLHQWAVTSPSSRANLKRSNLPDESSRSQRSRYGEPFTDPHLAGRLPNLEYSSVSEENTTMFSLPGTSCIQQPSAGFGMPPEKRRETLLSPPTPSDLLASAESAWVESSTIRSSQQPGSRISYTVGIQDGQFRPPHCDLQYTSVMPAVTVARPSSSVEGKDLYDDAEVPKRCGFVEHIAHLPGEMPDSEQPSSSGDSLRLYIVPSRYPSELLDDEEMYGIENNILDAIFQIHDERMRPTFNGSYHNNGRYEVICGDQFSKEWLYKYFSCLKEASLKIIPAEPSTVTEAGASLPDCNSDDEHRTRDAELYEPRYGMSSGRGRQEQEGYKECSDIYEPFRSSRRNLQDRLGPKVESLKYDCSRYEYIERPLRGVPRQGLEEQSVLGRYSPEPRGYACESEYVDQSWDVDANCSTRNTPERLTVTVEVARSKSPEDPQYLAPFGHQAPAHLRKHDCSPESRAYGCDLEYSDPPRNIHGSSAISYDPERSPSPEYGHSRHIEPLLHDRSRQQMYGSSAVRSYIPENRSFGDHSRYMRQSSSIQDHPGRYCPNGGMTPSWSPENSCSRYNDLLNGSGQEMDERLSRRRQCPVHKECGEPLECAEPYWHGKSLSSDYYPKRRVLEWSAVSHSRSPPSPDYRRASGHSRYYDYHPSAPSEPSRSDARERLRQIRSNRIISSGDFVERDLSPLGTSYLTHSQYQTPPHLGSSGRYRNSPSHR